MYESLEKITNLLENQGHTINDPWDIVEAFETKVATYAGSKFAISVDNCTNAIFLCLKYLKASGTITIPAKTYISVPQSILHAGCEIEFEDIEWSGTYQLKPYPIIDGATRFTKGMYIPNTYQCLSFHIKKILNIGKGGMILTDDPKAARWFKIARYEGRHIDIPYQQDTIELIGWNMYMPPEQAARGIRIFENLSWENDDCGGSWKYHDISSFNIFKNRVENE
jgi:dTDP-4-amino-4,6-dideoxygalactose transaminase